jgi:hypothetical protein
LGTGSKQVEKSDDLLPTKVTDMRKEQRRELIISNKSIVEDPQKRTKNTSS